MRRAIVTFIENKYSLKLQVAGLYMSLKYIQSTDTDLIVFGNKLVLSQLRFKCIKVPYHYDVQSLWSDYPFIYSLSCLNGPHATFLDDYDYLLRSDVDTFITPHWHYFYPDLYTFGKGGYLNTPEVKENLLLTAQKLGLQHHGIFNIGSTHYGPTSLIKEVHLLATEITDYLLRYSFLSDSGKWPSWYKGVASMYACELAVNHLVPSYSLQPEVLDFPSTSSDTTKNHPHIHCWHTDQLFSKFIFEKGGYHQMKLPTLAPSTINLYCLYMARLGKHALAYGKESLPL